MNQILSDTYILNTQIEMINSSQLEFARAIEKAVMQKLREQQEPVSNQLSGISGQVPAGYQLVPIEPTEAMLEAAWALNLDIEGIRQHCTNRYKEMLAAARSE